LRVRNAKEKKMSFKEYIEKEFAETEETISDLDYLSLLVEEYIDYLGVKVTKGR